MEHFVFALRFLTRLPVGKSESTALERAAKAVPWFPLVGLVIGCLLALFGRFLVETVSLPAFLSAGLVVALWVMLTGALHLDGLADSADAWMSCSSPSRMLEIMQDPRSGVGAVVVVTLTLLIKTAAIISLLEHHVWYWLVLPAIAGRVMMVLVLMFVPYVRKEGLGKSMKDSLNQTQSWLGIIVICLPVLIFWPAATLTVLIAALTAMAMTLFWIAKPLGGANGDVYGAVNELAEVGALIGLNLIISSGAVV